MYIDINTTDNSLTLDRAKELNLHVLQPLVEMENWTDQFDDFKLDLMQLIESIEVYDCCDLCDVEIAELHELNDEVTPQLDDLYRPIMEAYDEYLIENPDQNPDNPNQY